MSTKCSTADTIRQLENTIKCQQESLCRKSLLVKVIEEEAAKTAAGYGLLKRVYTKFGDCDKALTCRTTEKDRK